MTRLTAIAALALIAGPLAAQDAGPHPDGEATDPSERLDRLFASLSDEALTDPERVQGRIVAIWSDSGSDSMNFLLRRGREALSEDAHDKALTHLTALVELAPDFAEGWNARATVNFLIDEYWASVADIQRTLALEPRHFGALSGLGVIFERIGDDARALEAYREALRWNPHLDHAREAAERLAPQVDGRDI